MRTMENETGREREGERTDKKQPKGEGGPKKKKKKC